MDFTKNILIEMRNERVLGERKKILVNAVVQLYLLAMGLYLMQAIAICLTEQSPDDTGIDIRSNELPSIIRTRVYSRVDVMTQNE
jgi:hypothetical protein